MPAHWGMVNLDWGHYAIGRATLCRVDAFPDHRFNSIPTTRKRGSRATHKQRRQILSMSRLETAMNRLDAAMARLDAAVNDGTQRSDRERTSMEQELSA